MLIIANGSKAGNVDELSSGAVRAGNFRRGDEISNTYWSI